jgi:hypothetical protein
MQRRCCSNNNGDRYETTQSFYQTFFPVCAIRLAPGRRINRAERTMPEKLASGAAATGKSAGMTMRDAPVRRLSPRLPSSPSPH